MIRSVIFAFAAALAVPVAALSQEAVPLSDDLFDHAWVIVDYEGQLDVPALAAPTFFIFDRGDGDLGGQTPCDTDWTAKIEIDLPAVRITQADAFISDECPAFRNVFALLGALEQVTQAQTGPEGLELLAADGRRVLLMVAGG